MASQPSASTLTALLAPRRDTQAPEVSAVGRIPVEIWHRILGFAIACAMFPSRDDPHQNRRDIPAFDCHQIADYKRSEIIRTDLRLVCRSWDAFLEEHSDRFVQLNEYAPNGYWPPIKRWDHVVRLQGPRDITCDCPSSRMYPCWPADRGGPSILLPQVDRERLFPLLGNRCREIILPDFWRKPLADLLRTNSVKMVKEYAWDTDQGAIQSRMISSAYPLLTHLVMELPSLCNPSFHLDLPSLTSLDLAIVSTAGNLLLYLQPPISGHIGHWALPNLRHLHLLLYLARQDDVSVFHTLLKHIGGRILDLSLSTIRNGFKEDPVSQELWDWLPQLRHFRMDLHVAVCMAFPAKNLGCDLTVNAADIGYWGAEQPMDDLRAKWTSGRSHFGRICIEGSWGVFKAWLERCGRSGAEVKVANLEIFDILHEGESGLEDDNGEVYSPSLKSELVAICAANWASDAASRSVSLSEYRAYSVATR